MSDVTVSLTPELRQRAKDEGINLSRMLRTALENELDRIDAMNNTLTDVQTYLVEMGTSDAERGFTYTGRITGKLIAGGEELGVYLTSDKRVLGYQAACFGSGEAVCKRLDDPPEDLVANLKKWLRWSDVPFLGACAALGVRAVIDL